jgi:CheY-like chemotaxis protein
MRLHSLPLVIEEKSPEEGERTMSKRSHSNPENQPEGIKAAGHAAPPSGERRSRRRALISAPVRVRQLDVTNGGPDEISTTLDVSRAGILFVNAQGTFEPGMEVAVTFPYSRSPVAVQAEQMGMVARVSDIGDGRRAVAVAFNACKDAEIVDSGGRKLEEKPSWTDYARGEGPVRPLILVMDADAALRESLKTYLTNDGYDVIVVGSAREARAVLDVHTPALLIAEIEGEDLPGYDLCAHVKATPRLQTVPVMLMTRSAYPSDYANAHSLGAIVCMAKPYRQERLGHVVRLLAPPPQAKDSNTPPRPADPKRKTCSAHASKRLAQQRIRLVR